jgi:hypothetical protein
VLLGQEAAAGLRLVDVRADGITLESDGGRTEYAVPPVTVAQASAPAPQFRRDGNSLTAPMQDPAAVGAPGQRPPGRFTGSVAPTPPSGMLVPPQRGSPDEPSGRLGQPGPGAAPGKPPGG